MVESGLKERKPAATNGNTKVTNGKPKNTDHRVDNSDEFEFGGSLGTGFVMVFFPILMWYLWVGQVYYDAQLPLPKSGQPISEFLESLYSMAREVNYPAHSAPSAYLLIESHYRAQCPLSKPGQSTGASLRTKVFFISLFPVYGLRGTQSLIVTISAWITTATLYGRSTQL